MQSLKRALLYPVAGWFSWMGVIFTAYWLVPTSLLGSAFFVSMQTALSATLVVLFSVLYLRKVQQSSAREGFFVGLTALAIVVALDVIHNLVMSIDLGTYFATVVPAYFIIPVITTLLLGRLVYRRRA